jgi:hypothetical protein
MDSLNVLSMDPTLTSMPVSQAKGSIVAVRGMLSILSSVYISWSYSRNNSLFFMYLLRALGTDNLFTSLPSLKHGLSIIILSKPSSSYEV